MPCPIKFEAPLSFILNNTILCGIHSKFIFPIHSVFGSPLKFLSLRGFPCHFSGLSLLLLGGSPIPLGDPLPNPFLSPSLLGIAPLPAFPPCPLYLLSWGRGERGFEGPPLPPLCGGHPWPPDRPDRPVCGAPQLCGPAAARPRRFRARRPRNCAASGTANKGMSFRVCVAPQLYGPAAGRPRWFRVRRPRSCAVPQLHPKVL